MEVKMKHRIVGILVVVALAVIVIPMFFTRSGINTNEPKLSAKIPAAPSQPQTELKLPPQPKTVDLSQQQSLTQVQTQTMQTTNNAAPVVNAAPTKSVAAIPAKPTAAKLAQPTVQSKTALKKKTVATQKTASEKQMALPTGKAFNIQLGTFADSKNANALVSKLRKAGFTAYTKSVKRDNKNLERVLVGPVSKRSQAETMIKSLQTKFKLKGIVVDYKV